MRSDNLKSSVTTCSCLCHGFLGARLTDLKYKSALEAGKLAISLPVNNMSSSYYLIPGLLILGPLILRFTWFRSQTESHIQPLISNPKMSHRIVVLGAGLAGIVESLSYQESLQVNPVYA